MPSCSSTFTSTPTSRSSFWIVCATSSRTAKPACVMSVKASGLPPLSRMPSASLSVQPASSSSARAFAGSYAYFVTFGLYAHDTGWIGPSVTGASPSRIVRVMSGRSIA